MIVLRVKGWAEFQHYKDRSPSWIKLHKRLLDDWEFHSLPLASRALAPMLWLLASESLDGEVRGTADKICFRLHISQSLFLEAVKPLINSGFFELIEDASKTLADCKRTAIPEKRREEGETEKSREETTTPAAVAEDAIAEGLLETAADAKAVKNAKAFKAKLLELPDWLPREVWDNFRAHRQKLRKPMTDEAERLALKRLCQLRSEGHDAVRVVEHTIYSGWQKLFPEQELPRGKAPPTPSVNPADEIRARRGAKPCVSLTDSS